MSCIYYYLIRARVDKKSRVIWESDWYNRIIEKR